MGFVDEEDGSVIRTMDSTCNIAPTTVPKRDSFSASFSAYRRAATKNDHIYLTLICEKKPQAN